MALDVTLVDRVHVPFSGLRAREGPLTVGQRNVLRWLGKPGTAAIGVYRWILTIPDGATVDDVRATFAALLAQHEILRTTFHLDGEPRQRVAGEGRLPIDIYSSDSDLDEAAVAARLDTVLRATPFDLASELPLRVALLVVRGTVRVGVTIYTHMAMDVGGMALVGRQFTELAADPAGVARTLPDGAEGGRLAGGVDGGRLPESAEGGQWVGSGDGSWQPLDRAAWEMSPSGQRQLHAALRYWERQLRTVPHCVYALPTTRSGRAATGDWAPPGSTAAARRSPAFELRSPAAAIAVPHIAARTGTSPTMVVVAAFVAVLARRTSHRRCAFVALVGNRMGRHLHGYVGTLAGPSLVVVDTDVGGFDELVRRTGSASLTAARHAVIDVGALKELAQEVYRERGVVFARDVVVNNVHHALGQAAGGAAPSPLTELPAAIPRTTAKWTEWERVPQLLNFRMFRLDDTELTFRLGTASVTWVPPADLEMMARGIESLLLAAASADVGLARLGEVTGVEPAARGPGWRYIDGCWVDLAQVRRLVADALAPAATSVFFESTEDGADGLVAYLAEGQVSSAAQAHERCVAALPGPLGLEYHTYVTIAPGRYVLCAGAPDDVDDLAAWRRQPVLAEGDGRTLP